MSAPTATVTAIVTQTVTADDDSSDCGNGGGDDRFLGLRIASVFIILATSMFGALFPVIAKRTRLSNVIPKPAFEYVAILLRP